MASRVDEIETMCFVIMSKEMGMKQSEIALKMGRNRRSVQSSLLKYEKEPSKFEPFREEAKKELIKRGILSEGVPKDIREEIREGLGLDEEKPEEPQKPEGEGVGLELVEPPKVDLSDIGETKLGKTLKNELDELVEEKVTEVVEEKVKEKVVNMPNIHKPKKSPKEAADDMVRDSLKREKIPDSATEGLSLDAFASDDFDDEGIGPDDVGPELGELFDEEEQEELKALEEVMTMFGVKKGYQKIILKAWRVLDDLRDYNYFMSFLGEIPYIGYKKAKMIATLFFGELDKIAKRKKEKEMLIRSSPRYNPFKAHGVDRYGDDYVPRFGSNDYDRDRFDDRLPVPPRHRRGYDDLYDDDYDEPYPRPRRVRDLPSVPPVTPTIPLSTGPSMSQEDIEEEINRRVQEGIQKYIEEEQRRRQEEEERKKMLEMMTNAIKEVQAATDERISKLEEMLITVASQKNEEPVKKEESSTDKMLDLLLKYVLEDSKKGDDSKIDTVVEQLERKLEKYESKIENLRNELKEKKSEEEKRALRAEILSLKNELNSIKEGVSSALSTATISTSDMDPELKVKLAELTGKMNTMNTLLTNANKTVNTLITAAVGGDSETVNEIRNGDIVPVENQWDDEELEALDKELADD